MLRYNNNEESLMSLKRATLTLIIAIVLALTATLSSLARILPAPLAYFLIALVAAALALMIAGPKQSAGSAPDSSKHRSKHASTITGRSASAKEQGQVKWFSASKGFGFITRDSGEDIFVHFRSINSKGNSVLREGQRVEFTVGNGSKGLQAEDVTALP